MSRIAVVGGHGSVARHLHPLLVAAGHTPLALVRNRDHLAELEALGAEVGLLDIESSDVDAFAAAFAGCDAVVFAAGAGADGKVERKRTVDLEGSTKSVAAAEQAGIRRFVQVSAMGVDQPLGEDVSDVWRAYVEAKRDADAVLRASSLDWTVVRPGQLTDDEPTGRVDLREHVERGAVPRADVAAVVAACLADDRSVGAQFELVSGPEPIEAAVATAPRFAG
ncbi:NAD-dependent epimerase/dehydratase family protein [Desertihabitans brevis]|uniref:NAD-dependent epimerase/dehydratase family protein n=1 Tax=Desertihabitans brevis TaxID=2268447 RepID=A0A367YZA2_9ACTN|nr:NAD(P)H-binding protein [Desertihabitans brevis]RCK71174.1 NAD-dependent epimerase/dehydratase family protein [Desertihabitans brevis]